MATKHDRLATEYHTLRSHASVYIQRAYRGMQAATADTEWLGSTTADCRALRQSLVRRCRPALVKAWEARSVGQASANLLLLIFQSLNQSGILGAVDQRSHGVWDLSVYNTNIPRVICNHGINEGIVMSHLSTTKP